MIRMMAAALAGLLIFCAGGALAQTNPDWLEKPDGADLSAAYPKFAQFIGVEGHALISCKVARTGRLDDCVVIEETPRGLGFGKAALGLVPYFRMAPGTSGGSAREGMVRIPIRFALPAGDNNGRAVLALGLGLLLLGALALNDWVRGRSAPRMPVFAAVIYSLGFAARTWRRAPGPLLLYLGLFALSRPLMLNQAEPSGWQALVSAASFVISLLIAGAGLRLAFAQSQPEDRSFRLGPLGFQVGAVERRVLTAGLLKGLIVGALIAAMAVVGLTVVALRPAFQTPLAAGVAGAGVLVCVYAVLRLWTLTPATVFYKRLSLREAWRASRAAIYSPLAAALLILLAALLIGMIPIVAAGAVNWAMKSLIMGDTLKAYPAIVMAIAQPAWIGLLAFTFRTLHQPQAAEA